MLYSNANIDIVEKRSKFLYFHTQTNMYHNICIWDSLQFSEWIGTKLHGDWVKSVDWFIIERWQIWWSSVECCMAKMMLQNVPKGDQAGWRWGFEGRNIWFTSLSLSSFFLSFFIDPHQSFLWPLVPYGQGHLSLYWFLVFSYLQEEKWTHYPWPPTTPLGPLDLKPVPFPW